MIAGGDVRKLKIAFDMRAVLIEDPQKVLQLLSIHLRRVPEQQEGAEQIHRSERQLHCAAPVNCASDWILCAPAGKLAKKFGAELWLVGKNIRATQSDQVSQTIELPEDAHV